MVELTNTIICQLNQIFSNSEAAVLWMQTACESEHFKGISIYIWSVLIKCIYCHKSKCALISKSIFCSTLLPLSPSTLSKLPTPPTHPTPYPNTTPKTTTEIFLGSRLAGWQPDISSANHDFPHSRLQPGKCESWNRVDINPSLFRIAKLLKVVV